MEHLFVEQILAAVPILEAYEKVLTAKIARDEIMQAQTNVFFQMGMENPDLMKAGFSMFDKNMDMFGDDLFDIFSKFQGGRIGMAEAMARWKRSTGKFYQELFRNGTAAIGNPYYRDIGLTKKDRSFINKMRRVEGRHFNRFLQDIKDPLHGAPLGTPGRRVMRHPYHKRITYYKESGKAAFMNGMVAGAGNQMDIWWRLGVPTTEHCPVCPIYAGRKWTWKTLKTVPRAGDTPCLFKCYCHLEFTPRRGKIKGLPKQILSPGMLRHGAVYDSAGMAVEGQLLDDVDALYSKMYKARQMAEITKGKERMSWLGTRKELNRQLIDMQARHPGYRFVPTQSVRDLLQAVKYGATYGGEVKMLAELTLGAEVLLVRGTFSAVGTVSEKAGRKVWTGADGKEVYLDDLTDIHLLQRTPEFGKVQWRQREFEFMKRYGLSAKQMGAWRELIVSLFQ